MEDLEEDTEFVTIGKTQGYFLGMLVHKKTRLIQDGLVWLDPDSVHDLLSQIPVAAVREFPDMCKRYPSLSLEFYRKQLGGMLILAKEPELLFGLDVTQEQLQNLLPVLDKVNNELFEWDGRLEKKDLQIQAEIVNNLHFLYEAAATNTPLADLRVQQNKLTNVGDSAEKWLTHQATLTADIESNKDTAKLILSRLVNSLPDGTHSLQVYSAQLDKETHLGIFKKLGLVMYVNTKEAVGAFCVQEGCEEKVAKTFSQMRQLLQEENITLAEKDTVIDSFTNTLAVAYAKAGTLKVTDKERNHQTNAPPQTKLYGYRFSNCSICAISEDELFWPYMKNVKSQNISDIKNVVCLLAPDLGI